MTQDYFHQRKSGTNAALAAALGSQLATPYLTQADGGRPQTRYRLGIEASAIRCAPLSEPDDADGRSVSLPRTAERDQRRYDGEP